MAVEIVRLKEILMLSPEPTQEERDLLQERVREAEESNRRCRLQMGDKVEVFNPKDPTNRYFLVAGLNGHAYVVGMFPDGHTHQMRDISQTPTIFPFYKRRGIFRELIQGNKGKFPVQEVAVYRCTEPPQKIEK